MAKPAVKNYQEAEKTMMQDKCVCLSVEFHMYGTKRKVDMATVEVDADKTRMQASKRILDSKNIASIHRVWRKTYNWLWTKCLPAPLRAGMYCLPVELIDEVNQKLASAQLEIRPYVDALIAELPELKQKDRDELRSQFREEDYPTEPEIESAFYIESQYIDFKVPDKLRQISKTLYAREVAKQISAWDDAKKETVEFLRATGDFLVGQFVKQLKVDDTTTTKKGAPKKAAIFPQTIKNLQQFVKDFDVRNIADDGEMMAIVAKAKGLLDGIDADTLRGNDSLRAKLYDKMEAIKTDLDGLMKAPRRAIELE